MKQERNFISTVLPDERKVVSHKQKRTCFLGFLKQIVHEMPAPLVICEVCVCVCVCQSIPATTMQSLCGVSVLKSTYKFPIRFVLALWTKARFDQTGPVWPMK